jgi:Mg-chelatase subunit ChlD
VTLLYPVWLLLLLPLGVALWAWRLPTRLLLALRLLTVTLVVLAACGLALKLPSRTGTVVVVADRSLSMPPNSEAAMKESIDLVQAAMGPDDQLAVVSFGQATAVERPPKSGPFGGFTASVGGNASNLGEALDTALSLIPRDGPGRVLVLSDGRWTGRDPAGVAPIAAARGVALDYRSLQRAGADDLAVARVDAPATVSPGESFLITAWVHASTAQAASFELRRDGRILSSGKRRLTAGLNRITFRDRAVGLGHQAYRVTVTGTREDPVPENNSARFLVGVGGPRPLLHVRESAGSGLAKLLRAGGLKVREMPPGAVEWTLEGLSRYSAVVLENVPAEKVGAAGMETLAEWVRATGSGLLMTGGRSSYGPGGYYKSPLEPILPVSMELRNEHRKLAMAIVVALDRSGSMAVSVGGGKKKMDLANQGAAAVLDLMGPMDEFGCIAIDTVPHTIAPLKQATDKAAVRKDILRIESMGGGIFVYVALVAAADVLKEAKAGTKHIILFADANDAEEPGKYEELLAAIRKAGMTVSVIGLGTEKDKDAELLKDIAKRGSGRVFFTDKPEELPRLFAQDTFVVARNTFLDEPTPVRTTPGLTVLTDRGFTSPANLSVGGYNLCYLRPGATLGTVTLDEYKAPLVAAWRAGSGRVVCYTGEADGKYSGAIARWGQVGDYFTSLARWAAGPTGALPDNMLLTQEVREGVNVVQLHLDPDRKGESFRSLPKATTLRAAPGGVPRPGEAALRWTGADTLAIEVPLEGNETALTTVDVPGYGAVVLPPVCLPYSPEYKPAQGDRGLATLEKLGRATGGKERVELAGIWKDLPRRPRLVPVARWLLAAALVLLLLEVLERRTGLVARPLQLLDRREREPAEAKAKRVKVVVPPRAKRPTAPQAPAALLIKEEKPAPEPPPAAPPAATETGLVEALRKARERTRGRMD